METTSIGRSHTVHISDAILIYGNRAATLHGVHVENGVPTILPGQPITPDHLRSIVCGLAEMEAPATPPKPPKEPKKQKAEKSLNLGILPINVVFADVGQLVFWIPGGRRPLFFENDKFKRFNNKKVRHPALIFSIQVGKGVEVFALRSSKRPDAGTRLYQAPYFNVYDGGNVCHGSAPFPKTPHPRFIQQCLDAFFLTKFTHQSTTGKLVDGTYLQYLQAMSKWKDPRPWLIDVHLNFGDYISGKRPNKKK